MRHHSIAARTLQECACHLPEGIHLNHGLVPVPSDILADRRDNPSSLMPVWLQPFILKDPARC
jgi:hypothetical protein